MLYRIINRNKKPVCIDLRNPSGRGRRLGKYWRRLYSWIIPVIHQKVRHVRYHGVVQCVS
jgi:hypothetical protein